MYRILKCAPVKRGIPAGHHYVRRTLCGGNFIYFTRTGVPVSVVLAVPVMVTVPFTFSCSGRTITWTLVYCETDDWLFAKLNLTWVWASARRADSTHRSAANIVFT